MDIHLLRHTRTAAPDGTCYGSTDVALPFDWAASAAAVVERLPGAVRASARVYTSPLGRCAQMASLLGRTVSADPRLKELDFGVWEMRRWSEIPRNEVNAWNGDLLDAVPHGGESVRSMYARAADFLDSMCGSGAQTVVVFSHGGPIRCMLSHALGMAPQNLMRLHLDFGAASLLRRSGGRWRLIYSNR